MRSGAPPIVDVLLATYNGERFLQDLLNSLVDQNCEDWGVIAADDNSTDATSSILRPGIFSTIGRFSAVESTERLGVIRNFEQLLARSSAQYFMLCDQDDVWLPDKISRMLSHIKELEQKHGKTTPILVQSDLVLVDRNLDRLSESYWEYNRINPWRARLPGSLLYQNLVVGCATIGNAALRRLSLPFPPEVMMHDWWLGLIAAHAGKLEFMRSPTVLYRQHQGNLVGSHRRPSMRSAALAALSSRGASLAATREAVGRTMLQAAALAERLEGVIPEEKRRVIVAYARLRAMTPARRRLEAIRLGLLPQRLVSRVAFLLAL